MSYWQPAGRVLLGFFAFCAAILTSAEPLFSQANVLIFSSGDRSRDSELEELLKGYGHKVILGVEYPKYTGGGLKGIDVVFLQAADGWNNVDMPTTGQQDLLNFVSSGGGLITTRPIIWNQGDGSEFAALRNAFPAEPANSIDAGKSISYAQNSLDQVLNAGLPAYFSFQTGDGLANETMFSPRPGATVFFQSNHLNSVGTAGVIGWSYGNGRVLSLSALLDEVAMKDANCSRLLHNSIVWTTPIPEPSAGLLAMLASVTVFLRRRRKV